MITFTANQAKTRFGEFLDIAQREPVRVMKHDRLMGVMVSGHDYQNMQRFYADQLVQTLREASSSANMTESEVEALLADES